MLVLGLDRDDRARPGNGDVRGSLSLHDRRRCRGSGGDVLRGLGPARRVIEWSRALLGRFGRRCGGRAAAPFPGGGGVTRKEGGGAGGAGGGGGAGGRTRVEDGSGVNATVLPTSGESGRT